MVGVVPRADLYNSGARTLSSGDLVTTGVLTVSSTGIRTGAAILNGGANYGPDTPGTKTFGINEALAAVPTGGTVEIWGGSYEGAAWTTYLFANGLSNVRISIAPDAVFTIPSSPAWKLAYGSASDGRYPAFVFSGCSDVDISGGHFTSATPLPGTGYSEAIFIGDNNTRVKVHDVYGAGLGSWLIIADGNWTDVNGTGLPPGTVRSGAYSYISEYRNTVVNSGNRTKPDGGGIRFQNTTGANSTTVETCHHLDLGLGTVIFQPTGLYGYDISSPFVSQQQIQDITIWDPQIDLGTASSTQLVGINLEPFINGLTSSGGGTLAGQCGNIDIVAPHVTGGYHGLWVGGGWTGVTVHGGTYEKAWVEGMMFYTSTAVTGLVLSDITIIGPRSINNNQSGTAGSRFAGLMVGVDTSSKAGVVRNVNIQGGTYADTQASATQNAGIAIVCNVAGGLVDEVTVTGGSCYGNTGALGAQLAVSWTNGTMTNLSIEGVTGFNPALRLTNPVGATAVSMISQYGTTLVPTASVTYTNSIPNLVMSSSSGTSVAITVTAMDGTVLVNGAATMASQSIPLGATVTFGAFTGAPTVTATVGGTTISKAFETFTPFGYVSGGSATLVASTLYKVFGGPLLINLTGGTGVSLSVKDAYGFACAGFGTATPIVLQLPSGFQFNGGAFSPAPTVTASGN